MVQFKVGDNVNICAYVRDWCGTYTLKSGTIKDSIIDTIN